MLDIQYARPDRCRAVGKYYTYTFFRYDVDYHVAMYAVDDAGNRGNLSNIVVLRVPAPPTEPPTEGPSSPGGDSIISAIFL